MIHLDSVLLLATLALTLASHRDGKRELGEAEFEDLPQRTFRPGYFRLG